jgi:hypothetical protein
VPTLPPGKQVPMDILQQIEAMHDELTAGDITVKVCMDARMLPDLFCSYKQDRSVFRLLVSFSLAI